jgi:2-polyprenyl-3-methyl-5-hydroxy-6-metoxy-1,4-benzoquinol methylase
MMEGGTPKVDFDEIMGRVRAEVQRRRGLSSEPHAADGLGLDLLAPDLEQVGARLHVAEQVADVGARLPPMHRQHGLKRWIAALVAKAFLRLGELVNRDQRLVNRSLIYALRSFGSALEDQSRKIGARIGTLAPHLDALAQRQARLEAMVEQAVKDVLGLVKEVTAQSEQSRAFEEKLLATLDSYRAKLRNLEVTQLLQERRTSTLLEVIGRQPKQLLNPEQTAVVAQEQAHLFDAMYGDFEDAYRGTREDIKQRAREYMLAPVREAGAGTPERPVLDLGCGRGEWLEVLSEDGLEGRGVDLNRAFVHECSLRKLQVEEADVLSYLKRQPDESLGAVTAIHLMEHLPFQVLVGILDEAIRVLRPGGLVVFETPNPTNLTVGARDFYLDPTHRNPLHPETMRFIAERRGLIRVSVLPLHPSAPELRLPDDGTLVTQRLNELFYGPRDFAILGYRA